MEQKEGVKVGYLQNFINHHPVIFALIVFGLFIFVVIFFENLNPSSSNNTNNTTASAPSNPQPQSATVTNNAQPITNSNVVTLGDLNQNPSLYDGRVITVQGTVIGIQASTESQSQISDGDYSAYLVDSGNALSLSIYQNPAIKNVQTGDKLSVTGKFTYAAYPDDTKNNLANSMMTIDSQGTITITGSSSSVVPASQVTEGVKTLLTSDAGNIVAAEQSSANTKTFDECTSEYIKIWNDFCSSANLPTHCIALQYLDSVTLINNATNNLLAGCYKQFSVPPGGSSDALKYLIQASNNSGMYATAFLTQ